MYVKILWQSRFLTRASFVVGVELEAVQARALNGNAGVRALLLTGVAHLTPRQNTSFKCILDILINIAKEYLSVFLVLNNCIVTYLVFI